MKWTSVSIPEYFSQTGYVLDVVLSTVGTLVTVRDEAPVTEVPPIQWENQTKHSDSIVHTKYGKCDEGNTQGRATERKWRGIG